MDNIDDVEDIVFSQPMSSARQVAHAIVKLAKGERAEITMPASSGKLLNLAYLFPSLRRKLRPLFSEKGRKNKDKFRNRSSTV